MMQRYNLPKWILYTVLILILCILQLQISVYPRLFNVTPLFLIPAVISLSMIENETVGGIYGVVAGLLWDTGTGHAFGFNGLFLMIIGLACGLFVKVIFKKSTLSAVIMTAVFTFLHECVTWFFFSYLSGQNDLGKSFLQIILPTTLMTVVFAILIFILFNFVGKKLSKQDTNLSV